MRRDLEFGDSPSSIHGGGIRSAIFRCKDRTHDDNNKLAVVLTTVLSIFFLLVLFAILLATLPWKKHDGQPPREPYSFDNIFDPALAPKSTSLQWFAFPSSASEEWYTKWETTPSNSSSSSSSSSSGECYISKVVARTQQSQTFISASTLQKYNISCNTNFEISSDSNYVFFMLDDMEQIYRHSYKASYVVYNIAQDSLVQLSQQQQLVGKKQIYLEWSPVGSKLAFVSEDNNLYVFDADTNELRQVTTDGDEDVFNGIPDWVYEEEILSSNKALWWSQDGRRVAFLHLNDTGVPDYFYPYYPDNPDTSPYPISINFRYPKAGYPNPTVSVHVYDYTTQQTNEVNILSPSGATAPLAKNDSLVFNVVWANATTLCVIEMNRIQNRRLVLIANMEDLVDNNNNNNSGTSSSQQYPSRAVMETNSPNWIDEKNALFFIQGGQSFVDIVLSDDHYHLALFDTQSGQLIRYLTSGDWDVTWVNPNYGVSSSSSNNNNNGDDMLMIYYISTEASSVERHLYSVSLQGTNKSCLTCQSPGTYSALFSPSGAFYMLSYSADLVVPQYTLRSTLPQLNNNNNNNGNFLVPLEMNEALNASLQRIALPPARQFTQFTAADGTTQLNAFILFPRDFDDSGRTNKKYPVLMNVYGGPGSQLVANKFQLGFHAYLAASLGYVVVCADGRGTGARGDHFMKQVYGNLGDYESADQVAVAQHLQTLKYVDRDAISIWGWSFGGYTTLMSVLHPQNNANGARLFRAGISVAPVTDWHYYDSVYTERYMNVPTANPLGYARNSVLNRVNKNSLNSTELLLVHGTGDDNVHPSNSFELIKVLVAQEIQFDLFMYPNKAHSLSGAHTQRHLYAMIANKLQTAIGRSINAQQQQQQQSLNHI